MESDTTTVVNNIVASIRKVHDAGCRKILVLNLPDLSLFPEFRDQIYMLGGHGGRKPPNPTRRTTHGSRIKLPAYMFRTCFFLALWGLHA
jgi:hypothetical protein